MTDKTKKRSRSGKKAGRPAREGRPPIASTVSPPENAVSADGKPVCSVCGAVISDITELEQAEERARTLLAEAQNEKMFLSTLINSITDEVWFADTQGRFTLANPAALQEFGLDLDRPIEVEALAKSLEVLRPDGSPRPITEAPPLRALSGELVKNQEEIVRTPSTSELRYRQVSAVPVRDPLGRIVGAVSVVRDITELKKAEDELRSLSIRQDAILAAVPDIIMEVNTEKVYTWANPVGLEFFGEDVIGKEAADYFMGEQETYAIVKPLFNGREDVFYVESWQRRRDGEKRLLAWWCHALKDAEGPVIGAISTARDITELKRAEETLRESEGQLHAILEDAPDGVYLNDLAGSFLHGNRRTEEIIGYKREEIIGKNMMELNLLAPEDLAKAAKLMQESAKGKSTGPDELTLIKKDGSRIMVEINTSVVQRHGRPVVIGFVRDITERKRAGEALRESEGKYRTLIDNAGEAIFVAQGGKLVFVNPMTARLLGYPIEEIKQRPFTEFIHPDDRNMVVERYLKRLKGEELPEVYSFRVFCKDGRLLWVDIRGVRIHWEGQAATLNFVSDITERKGAEDELRRSEARLSTALQMSRAGYWEYDVGRDMFTFNDNFYRMFRTTAAEMGGYEMSSADYARRFCHPEDASVVADENRMALESSDPNYSRQIEHRILYADGEVGTITVRFFIIKDDHGHTVKTYGVNQDITERKRAEETIQTSLREKEVLLREIHHRVKNNMQVISSLFNLQAGHIKDEEARRMLKEGQLRIRSMALIHEKLYQSCDLSGIEFGGYLQSLADHLFHFFRVDAGLVRLETDLGEARLSINSAVPCGLIANELISNALKHAFPGGRKGVVRIGLRREADGTVKVRIADDGAGLPESLDFRRAESFGFQIVTMLVEQIEGTIELDRENGTAFTVAFRELEYKQRN